MRQLVFEPVPVELMALLEHPDERNQWLRAAQRLGISLIICQDASDVLAQLSAKQPDGLLLPLGEREEESLLLCRAVLRRQSARGPCPVFFYDRGARLVKTDADARRVGAEGLLPDLLHRELLQAVLAQVDVPLDAEVPEEWPTTPQPQGPFGFGSPPRSPSTGLSVVTRVLRPSASEPQAYGGERRVDWGEFAPPPVPASASPAPPARASAAQAFSAWLKETLGVARRDHYLAFLGLGLDATGEQAQAALRAQAQRLGEGRRLPGLLAEAAAEVEELQSYLEDAWEVLAHPVRLVQYQRALERAQR
jgi:hypothetical protein